MMGAIENSGTQSNGGPIATCSPTWKLYDNPHFSQPCHDDSPHHHRRQCHYNCFPPRSLVPRGFACLTFGPMEAGGGGPSDLLLARAQVEELRAELEFERRIRRKAESLNKVLARELGDERRAREAAESACRHLAEEVTCKQEEAQRAAKELEEERRMLRIAEAWREERVQMKLAEARVLMEEKLREVSASSSSSSSSSSVVLPLPATHRDTCEPSTGGAGGGGGGEEIGGNQESQQKKEVAENPHIKRGIKGFVEFPRAVRVKVRGGGSVGSSPGSSREGVRGHWGSNLECQRAQLRILLRQKNPAGPPGLAATAENLVM